MIRRSLSAIRSRTSASLSIYTASLNPWRNALPVIPGNGLGELLAKLVELQLRIGQLAIDKPQSFDGHSDMRGRSLNGSLSHAERRLAQLAQHLGCVETTYTVLLQNALNSLL
jgi:hypothetical protein